MVDAQNVIEGFEEAPPSSSEFRRFVRVFLQRKIVLFGLIVLAVLIFVAIFAELLAPHDPFVGVLDDSLEQPNSTYLLGTDRLGRDTLSRLIFGTRTTLLVGFVTTGVSGVTGIFLGLVAGYFGGVINMVIMRIMDALMGFPMLLLALMLSAVLGGGIQNVIIALAIAMLPGYARVMHGLTLSIRENDYIMAGKSMGASDLRTMLLHILPNAAAPMLVLVTMQLGGLILAEAALSFLGIGIKPPGAAWGAMANDGRMYLLYNPILAFAPSAAIMLVAFSFQVVGDGLRDALDPRLRGLL